MVTSIAAFKSARYSMTMCLFQLIGRTEWCPELRVSALPPRSLCLRGEHFSPSLTAEAEERRGYAEKN